MVFIVCTWMNLARNFLLSLSGTITCVKTHRMGVHRKGRNLAYNIAAPFTNTCFMVITLNATEGDDKYS